MNILSFDIEEWAIDKAEGTGTKERYALYDAFLDHILTYLDEKTLKGTFFCTGMMAKDFPKVVKLIHDNGHEIGCHSCAHTWMNKMTEAEAKEDTYRAVDALEQCIGEKVLSYRAPAFSIGEHNKWMFEVLANNGIERDASIFPASRDFGGFPNFGVKIPCMVSYNGIVLKEFPICTAKLFGKEFACSGGGYFRFFPLWFVEREIKSSTYVMTYFHIADLTPDKEKMMSRKEYEEYFMEPGTLLSRYKRYLKANYGKKTAFNKLLELIDKNEFVNIEQAAQQIEWDKHPVVGML